MSNANPAVLLAHSVAEVRFYLALTACPSCGRLAMRPRGDPVPPDAAHAHWRCFAGCAACLRDFPAVFVLDTPPDSQAPGAAELNPAGRPSRIIDAVGWVTLYRFLLESAGREPDKRIRRETICQAGHCLDEALKFYPPGEDVLPESAFFSPEARERFRRHAELFDRRVVLHHRSRLPAPPSAARTAGGTVRRRWWQFWRPACNPLESG